MKFTKLIVAALAVTSLVFLAGCDSDKQPVETASAAQVDQMKALREIFDKHQGDQTQFTAEEKQKFLDYEKGDQTKVDNLIAWMKNPRGGGAANPSQPFEMGPGGKVTPKGSGAGMGGN